MTNKEIVGMFLGLFIVSLFNVNFFSETHGLIVAILGAAYTICITLNSHDSDDDDTDNDSAA